MPRPRKLTPEQARKAREWAAIGRSMKGAAKHFGVCPNVLRAYIRGTHRSRAA